MIFQSDPSLAPNQNFASTSGLGGQIATTDLAGPSSSTSGPNGAPLNPFTDTLTDKDLVMEKKSLGPFTERVLSALLPLGDPTFKPRSAVSDEGSPSKQPPTAGTSAAGTSTPSTMQIDTPGGSTSTLQTDLVVAGAGPALPSISPTPIHFFDLETRLRMELKACGLLGPEEVRYPLNSHLSVL